LFFQLSAPSWFSSTAERAFSPGKNWTQKVNGLSQGQLWQARKRQSSSHIAWDLLGLAWQFTFSLCLVCLSVQCWLLKIPTCQITQYLLLESPFHRQSYGHLEDRN
jgi:hypothetical protein